MKRNNKGWIIVVLIYIVAMIVATLYDQQITEYMYNPKQIFSVFIGKFTYVVSCYIVLLSVFVLIRQYSNQRRINSLIKTILLLLSFMCTSLVLWFSCNNIIVLILHIFSYSLFWKYMTTLSPIRIERLRRPAIYSLMIIATAILSVELLKLAVGRVRPRSLAGTIPFSPWYFIQGFKYKELVSSLEEIKSFPSGHSAWATASLTLLLYIKEFRWTNLMNKICVIVMIIWILIVMSTRLVLGAHFLSDTLLGSALMLLSYYVYTRHYYKRYYGVRFVYL